MFPPPVGDTVGDRREGNATIAESISVRDANQMARGEGQAEVSLILILIADYSRRRSRARYILSGPVAP